MGHQYFVIGAGSIGRRHHANLTALGANSQMLEWRCLDLASLERKLRSVGDAGLVIATATQVRLELIELCGRLDVPFYVEKPLAFRIDQLEHIRLAASPVAGRSIVGYMMRYHPAIRALIETPMEAYGFHMEIGHDVRQWRQDWRFAESYSAQPEGGGVLLDLCHEIDIAKCLFPGLKPVSVDSIGHADFPGVDFATRATLADSHGPTGTVAMDYLSPKSFRRMQLRGKGEVVDLDLLTCREHRWRYGKDEIRDWAIERNDLFLDLMRDFIALAEGWKTSDNPLLPRFDRVMDSAALIARCWEARQFHSTIQGDFS